MPADNTPQEPEDIINIASKAEYLKVDTGLGEVKLNSYNSVEVQPDGTLLGAKIKVEENGDITPTLTFDTKKLRGPKKNIDTSKMLDDAINDFWEQQS
jgi:hypothetical protein